MKRKMVRVRVGNKSVWKRRGRGTGVLGKRYRMGVLARKMKRAMIAGEKWAWDKFEDKKENWTLKKLNRYATGKYRHSSGPGQTSRLERGMEMWRRRGLLD